MSEHYLPENYSAFVTQLASKYSMVDINTKLGTLGLGLSGEAGEIVNLVILTPKSLDRQSAEEFRKKLADELGDICWYVAFGAANVLENVSFNQLYDEMDPDYNNGDIYDVVSSCPELMASCGSVADFIKKLIYHGKPFDLQAKNKLRDMLKVVMKNVVWLGRVGCHKHIEDLLKINVAKLSDRYKSLSFTTEEFMAKEAAKTDDVPATL